MGHSSGRRKNSGWLNRLVFSFIVLYKKRTKIDIPQSPRSLLSRPEIDLLLAIQTGVIPECKKHKVLIKK